MVGDCSSLLLLLLDLVLLMDDDLGGGVGAGELTMFFLFFRGGVTASLRTLIWVDDAGIEALSWTAGSLGSRLRAIAGMGTVCDLLLAIGEYDD